MQHANGFTQSRLPAPFGPRPASAPGEQRLTIQDPATLPPLLLTRLDAARMLAISPNTLAALTAPAGPIRCVRLGRAIRYPLAALQSYLDSLP